MTITIDKDVPLPGPRHSKYVATAKEMVPGDSVLFETNDEAVLLIRALSEVGSGYRTGADPNDRVSYSVRHRYMQA